MERWAALSALGMQIQEKSHKVKANLDSSEFQAVRHTDQDTIPSLTPK